MVVEGVRWQPCLPANFKGVGRFGVMEKMDSNSHRPRPASEPPPPGEERSKDLQSNKLFPMPQVQDCFSKPSVCLDTNGMILNPRGILSRRAVPCLEKEAFGPWRGGVLHQRWR